MNPFDDFPFQHVSEINPATGLPMISGDMTGFDIGGSPWGFDWSHDPFENHSVVSDDDWRSPWD